MNKTLYNLYINTTKEDKTKVYAINMSGEMQPNKTKAVCNTCTHIRIYYISYFYNYIETVYF